MFFDENKKAVATILSRRRRDGDSESSVMPVRDEMSRNEDGSVDERHGAALDIMQAVQDKSPQKMMDALAKFMDIHNSRKKDESPSDGLSESGMDPGTEPGPSTAIFTLV